MTSFKISCCWRQGCQTRTHTYESTHTHTHKLSPHPLDAICTPIHQCYAETVFTAVSVEQNQRWCRLVDMVNMTSRPCVFPPDSPWFLSPQRRPACLHNLLEGPACHRPGLLACHGADQPCVAATWRPVWQLTSITVTLSHSSFSRPHHKHDLQLGKWWTLGQRFRTWTRLFPWLKSQTRSNSIFNFTENEWLSYNDHNFPNLSQSPSLALQIIVENGSLVIQPEGKKASKMSLYLAVFDNQGHLDGWPLCCSGHAWTANMCIGVHWSKPPADTEQARGDRLAARRALTGHSF